MARELLPEGQIGGLSARDAVVQSAQDEWNARIGNLQAFTAGIKRENYLSAWANDKINKAIAGVDEPQYSFDPEYRFEDDELNKGYDPAIMVSARSAEEAQAFRDQIDYETEQLKIINANGWGMAGQMFGGVFQPHVAAALPVAGKSVLGAMVLEAGLEAGSEMILHNMQKTRTMEESFWNVGLTAVGVGILGGAAKGIDNLQSVPKDVIDEINAGALPGGIPEDSAGAARVFEEDTFTAEDDRLIGGKTVDFLSFGQVAALSKSVSQSARDIIARMADNPLFTKGNAAGKTRGVSVEALHEAAMGRVVLATDKAQVLQKQSPLSREEFDRQVGIAMSNGDRHADIYVQQAAEMYRREVVGPIQEAAGRLGLLETDESLAMKISMVEEDVQRLLDEGGAGPGSKKVYDDLKRREAAIVGKAEKTTKRLEARVATLEAKLAAARKPLKGTDKKRAAPKAMMDEYNKARSALTAHKKGVDKEAGPLRREMGSMKAQEKRLKMTRKKLKDLQTRKEKGGNLYAESYFPRVYNSEKIYDNWESLRMLLKDHFSKQKGMDTMEPVEIDELVTDTMMNMIGGKAQTVDKAGKPTALRARALSLLDNELETFLEKNATQIMLKHAQGMQPYILMREAFGGQSLDDMIKDIELDYKKAMEPVNRETGERIEIGPKQKELLAKQMQDDITRIRVVNDRIMHQVQRSSAPNSAATKAVQYAKLWNLTTFLGGVVLSSLPDLARPIAHYGLRSYGKGLAKAMAQAFSGSGSLSSTQVKRTGAAIQRTLNDRAMQLSDSLEPESKWLMRGQKFWSKASGFDWYTDIMESIAAHTAMDWVVRNAQKVASAQPLSPGDVKQMARMGLNDDDLVEIYHESMKTMGAQDTTLKYMNTMAWQNVDLAKKAEAAIGADVRRTIIRIGAGEKPQWMDGHTASWLFQFQSFAMSAQNKIMLAGFQNAWTRHTAEGVIAMMALGAGVGAAKTYLRGGDMDAYWTAENAVFEGIDRSGMIGILREPFNLLRFTAATQGWTDAVPSRYAGKGIERAFISPTATVLGNAGQALTSAISGDFEKARDHALKATPFVNNTWHIREVLTKLGED